MNISKLPKALLISPTFPGGYRNGLSMRSAMWLTSLSEKYEVTLLVLPIADTPTEFAKCCVDLMNDSLLRQNIAANAFQLFNDRYCLS
jgi:hypothetical protein